MGWMAVNARMGVHIQKTAIHSSTLHVDCFRSIKGSNNTFNVRIFMICLDRC